MAQESRKKDKIFFSYKEGTADTPDTDEYFEGRGMMTLPEPTWLQESDYGKLGSGEHGKATEIQAIGAPWSYKPYRMSEIGYLLAYFMGRGDEVQNSNSVYQHKLAHLTVSERTLPTFTFEYGLGSASGNKVFSGNVVNDFSITLGAGGNGVVDATFNGWGNSHYISGAALTKRTAGSMSTGENDFSSEPLVNFKSSNFYIATGGLESGLGTSSVDFAGEDLGTGLITLTSLVNSVTITGNNGMSMEDKLRAGGCGVINDFQRGDRRFTLEINFRKNDATLDAWAALLANTSYAFEWLFSGPYISGTAPYSIDMFLPLFQFTATPEDDGSPISRAGATEVFEDSNGDSAIVYVQNNASAAFNGTKS